MLLLVPSATYRARAFMEAAHSLGVEVTVASDRRQAMSAALGDRALTVPLHRPQQAAEAIVRLAERTPLDAVVAVDDGGVVAAAIASERLGLVHNAPAAAQAARDKLLMREALERSSVSQPGYRTAGPEADVAAVARAVGLPVVVKPVGLSGSRGVIRADDEAAAAAAAARIRIILGEAGEDPARPLLVERYVPGPEVALEGILRDGGLRPLALFDKPDPLEGPYFEERIYVTPSRLSEQRQQEVVALVAGAARALGLREGAVHAELRLGDGGPWVLELAARSIGGLCGRALRFGAGVSLEELVLRHALGRPLDGLAREPAASGVMMIPVPRSGTLHEVRGQEVARATPGVVGLELTIAPGRPVVALPEGDRYLGFIFARGSEPEHVERALREAHAALQIDIAE